MYSGRGVKMRESKEGTGGERVVAAQRIVIATIL